MTDAFRMQVLDAFQYLIVDIHELRNVKFILADSAAQNDLLAEVVVVLRKLMVLDVFRQVSLAAILHNQSDRLRRLSVFLQFDDIWM